MKYTATLSLLLSCALAFATGCSKDNEETVPSTETTLTRSIVYHDQARPTRRDTTFQTKVLVSEAWQYGPYFDVRVYPRAGKEGLVFNLERGSMPAALEGTYSLKTVENFDALDTEVSYSFEIPNTMGGSNQYNSNFHTVAGDFTITKFDTQRLLLDGTYTVTLVDVKDPMAVYGAPNPRHCDVIIRGRFSNLPLQTSK
ncbi:hypothetical protein [Hymenobacter lucidus]|uniref:DUF4382 domain-containing protein n=1 Tax=Hymenobacter lucidus TaxID=2880930 RepID=A0ABS8AJT5_9BACT|nr:hypothetical protein [Hymenobacter lucidus]MCB2406465.1 hypothetical protein [Hymenobacter lucidus]